jgi:hypothetical protein
MVAASVLPALSLMRPLTRSTRHPTFGMTAAFAPTGEALPVRGGYRMDWKVQSPAIEDHVVPTIGGAHLGR